MFTYKQNMMVILVLILCTIIHPTRGSPTGYGDSMLKSMVQLCGRVLATSLSRLCEMMSSLPDGVDSSDDSDSHNQLETSKQSQGSSSHISNRSKRDRYYIGGIADECCDQACPISTLLEYCPDT